MDTASNIAPDTIYIDVEIDLVYLNLQVRLNEISKKSLKMVLGDFNARVGKNYTNWQDVCGNFSAGNIN